MKALLFEKMDKGKVRCHLCHHRCVINSGKRGICMVRENRNGALESLVYGKIIARHIDPMEKKPLFHFLPGTLTYSLATVGCNFKCRFCQNSEIAQLPSDRGGMIVGDSETPKSIVADALRHNCKSISYTYTEPTVFFEFAYDIAKLANHEGLKNIFVTNGYMTPEAVNMIAPYLDAANVDLKAFSESFYKDYCSAKLDNVKTTLKAMKTQGIFLEITTLVIPGLNDDVSELSALAEFISETLGSETPWHISRFHPTYRLVDRSATPIETLSMAREIGIKAGLKYVFTGNVPGDDGEKTFCWNCHELLIDRWGFLVRKNRISEGRCPYCKAEIHGVGL